MKDRSPAEEFGGRLAQLIAIKRERLGISKLALSQKSGLDQRTVTFIERGTNSPSIQTLYLICSALETDMAELIAEALAGK